MKATSHNEAHSALKNIFNQSIHITHQYPKSLKASDQHIKKVKKFSDKLNNLKIKDSVSKKHKTSQFDNSTKIVKIKKNIELIYKQNKMTPTFVLHSYIKGGISYEDEKNAGSFFLLSRLLNSGYKGIDSMKLKEDLDLKASYLNGFSGKMPAE